MIDIKDSDYKKSIEGKDVMLLLWADWCEMCLEVIKYLEELEAEFKGRLIFAKVDIEKNPQTCDRFDLIGVPSAYAIKGGKLVDERAGFRPREQYREMVLAICGEGAYNTNT
ncbi:MAG: hypothetical protein LBM38_03945 [Clostridiales bacterium]|jgi:thioredoxin 1|nr:hypothetical protein [Clostridiales bacterium]